LRRRFPIVKVVLAPTSVQGTDAPAGIIAALQALNQIVHPDVILLARGGGSIEDLRAFNDVGVARAIVASQAPIITGVGHETDFTIADFAADLRAPTPTAAAELATPDQADLKSLLTEAMERSWRAVSVRLTTFRWDLDAQSRQLHLFSPLVQIRRDRQYLDSLVRRIGFAFVHSLKLRRTSLAGIEQRLISLNPQSVLDRGYAIVSMTDGRSVRRTTQVRKGDELDVRVSDGTFGVRVNCPDSEAK
jgi:exodeoxyribonuclease VII large subunit